MGHHLSPNGRERMPRRHLCTPCPKVRSANMCSATLSVIPTTGGYPLQRICSSSERPMTTSVPVLIHHRLNEGLFSRYIVSHGMRSGFQVAPERVSTVNHYTHTIGHCRKSEGSFLVSFSLPQLLHSDSCGRISSNTHRCMDISAMFALTILIYKPLPI